MSEHFNLNSLIQASGRDTIGLAYQTWLGRSPSSGELHQHMYALARGRHIKLELLMLWNQLPPEKRATIYCTGGTVESWVNRFNSSSQWVGLLLKSIDILEILLGRKRQRQKSWIANTLLNFEAEQERMWRDLRADLIQRVDLVAMEAQAAIDSYEVEVRHHRQLSESLIQLKQKV
jgi:hypothetical protein